MELNEEGFIAFRKEPAGRRLKRGEELEETRLEVKDIFDNIGEPRTEDSDISSVLDRLADKVPVAKFVYEDPKHAHYLIKIWLQRALKDLAMENKK